MWCEILLLSPFHGNLGASTMLTIKISWMCTYSWIKSRQAIHNKTALNSFFHAAPCVSIFSYHILLAPPPPATAPREPREPAAAGLWAGPDPALLWPWRCSALCRCPCTYLLHIFCPENTMFGSSDKGYSCRLSAIHGQPQLKGFFECYLDWGNTYSLGSLEFILQGVDFLLQVLDLWLLHPQHHLEKIKITKEDFVRNCLRGPI